MAGRVHLRFEDGAEADVELRMPLMVQTERHFKGDIPAIEGTLWACWKKLAPGMPFEQWMDTVEDMSQTKDDDAEVSAPLVEGPAAAS